MTISTEKILFLLFLAMVVVAAWFLFNWVERLKGMIKAHEREQEAFRRDLRTLVTTAVNVGERLSRCEHRVALINQNQKEIHERQGEQKIAMPAEDLAFEQALKLAQKGSSVEELMDICQITRGEADIIAMMHRQDSGRDPHY